MKSGTYSYFAKRLNVYLSVQGLSQRQFAKEIGVTSMTCSRWCDGQAIPRGNSLMKIAQAIGVSIESLGFDTNGRYIGEEKPASSDVPENVGRYNRPKSGSSDEKAFFENLPPKEQVESKFLFSTDGEVSRADLVQKFNCRAANIASIEIKTGSMSPTFVPGDKAVIERTDRFDSDGCYLLERFGKIQLRRAERRGSKFRLSYDNHLFEPDEVEASELIILAKVVGRIRMEPI